MKTKLLLSLFSLIFMFSGCATMFSGTDQSIRVNSEPAGANVSINGRSTGKETPCRVNVNRRQPKTEYNYRNELVIGFEKEGFETEEKHNSASFNAVTLLNVFNYGFGFIIDLPLGSHLKYDKYYLAKLDRVDPVEVPYRPSNQQALTKQRTEPSLTRVAYSSNKEPITNADSKISWVDTDAPLSNIHHPYRFALIIGNEDYSSHQSGLSSEVNVDYANRDAETFKQYAINTFGVPKDNIIHLNNASLIAMKRAISKMSLLCKSANGKAELFFYYAGHGLPHEQTNEPYILPVDVTGTDIEFAIKLSEVYEDFTEFPSKRITCFFDCCFSGGARNQGLVAARGVRVVPNEAPLEKNLVVFSASSGDQSAMGYDRENHGIFTYFLLKKLKESSGKTTYDELGEYLKENVAIKSLLVNSREQNPQVNTSADLNQEWRSWTFE